jgi:ribulose-5-phosphate 4-epimerase/fuculose-1-phosphate aldolase
VSRRNVSKQGITTRDFVPVRLINGQLEAYGGNKPSVDTPIQVRMYEQLPSIKYMMHSHVYVKGALFTDEAIPCGALEEVDSVLRAIKKYNINTQESFCLNLLGHGNIVFATDLDYFNSVEYIKRDIPERLD